MKPSRFAIGLVGLALAGLWYFAGGAESLPASSAAEAPPRVAVPLAHENLSVYFVYGPDSMPDTKVLSLSEALERELAVVHETSEVNTLAIENKSSEYELFVQSGDIVKGGKQDRMAATDMLLPPMSGVVAMKAHCVEQGRWTGRGTEDSRRFTSSTKCAAGKELKYANATFQQAAVWENVKNGQDKLNDNLRTTVNAAASPTSFQLALEAPAVQAKVAEYEAALKAAGADRAGVIGVVFVVNGQVTGAEVYGSGALFQKAWPKLLNAAAVEAVAERTDKPTAAAPSAREVERYLAYGATAEPAGGSGPAQRGSAPGLTNEDIGLESNLDAALPEIGRVSQQQIDEQRPALAPNAAGGQLGNVGRSGATTSRLATRGPGLATVTDPAPNAPGPQTLNRIVAVQDNIIMGGSGAARVQQPPANSGGNRLNSNRTENSSTLLVESRDPSRANAVIHRSFIKK